MHILLLLQSVPRNKTSFFPQKLLIITMNIPDQYLMGPSEYSIISSRMNQHAYYVVACLAAVCFSLSGFGIERFFILFFYFILFFFLFYEMTLLERSW